MNRHKAIVTDIKEYVEHFGNSRLTAKEIAHELHIHPSDVYRFFFEFNGFTLKRYLDKQMQNRLQQLLDEKLLTGREASRELGFTNEYSFYKWVKRVFGVGYKELLLRQSKFRHISLLP